jgi:GT2 family glycosyltransferase
MECDIVIPVWNQLQLTRDCIDSIEKNTGPLYRLVIIDNASDKDTAEYLGSLEKKVPARFRVIRNPANTGFIKAANRGMADSKSPFVCVMNNDTIATGGWLDELIAVAKSGKDIGIVNPSSNNLGQRPSDGEPLAHYADKLRCRRGEHVELGAAIGFCMLIKREVIDRIGLFDEIYGMGNFEDTDYSRRAVKEGFRCVRSCGSYVYHRESSSFGKVRTFDEDFRRNREIFEFRWGKPKRVAYVLDNYDPNAQLKLTSESVKCARGGGWVWYYPKERIEAPRHSNIIVVEPPRGNYYMTTAFRILKKKKRFDEIYVGDAGFGRILERLAFIHKAKIKYY